MYGKKKQPSVKQCIMPKIGKKIITLRPNVVNKSNPHQKGRSSFSSGLLTAGDEKTRTNRVHEACERQLNSGRPTRAVFKPVLLKVAVNLNLNPKP